MAGMDYPLEFSKPKDIPALPVRKVPAADPAKKIPAEKILTDSAKEIPAEKDLATGQMPALLIAEKDPVSEQAPEVG
jgi:hypothetical protein